MQVTVDNPGAEIRIIREQRFEEAFRTGKISLKRKFSEAFDPSLTKDNGFTLPKDLDIHKLIEFNIKLLA